MRSLVKEVLDYNLWLQYVEIERSNSIEIDSQHQALTCTQCINNKIIMDMIRLHKVLYLQFCFVHLQLSLQLMFCRISEVVLIGLYLIWPLRFPHFLPTKVPLTKISISGFIWKQHNHVVIIFQVFKPLMIHFGLPTTFFHRILHPVL